MERSAKSRKKAPRDVQVAFRVSIEERDYWLSVAKRARIPLASLARPAIAAAVAKLARDLDSRGV